MWSVYRPHMSRPQTSARPVRTLRSITGQDDQMLAGQPPRLSYGSSGDCGPGPVLSSTRGMGQLKEPSPCRTTDKSLVGWALRPHGGTVKDLLTAEEGSGGGGDRKMPLDRREQPHDPPLRPGWGRLVAWSAIVKARKVKAAEPEQNGGARSAKRFPA